MFPAPINIQFGTWLYGGSALCQNPSPQEFLYLLLLCDIKNIAEWSMLFEYVV